MDFDPSADKQWFSRYEQTRGTDARQYLLSNPNDILVSEQLHCYPRAENKFPTWHKEGMTYTRLAFEQSSGEIVAKYKASQVSGSTLLDLSGGLGIDSLAFSYSFDEVHYVDRAEQPFHLARNNHQIHKRDNIRHHLLSAEEALSQLPDADWIYIDPSRRNPEKRVFLLSVSEPDVPALWNRLLAKSDGIIIKLSPLYDLAALREELPEITRIQVVSVGGEVKEILAYAQKRPTKPNTIEAVCLPQNAIYASSFDENKPPRSVQSDFATSKSLVVPDAAVIKSGLTTTFATTNKLDFVNHNTDYLLSSETRPIPGASVYPISERLPYKPKELKKWLKDKRVNIHQRGFPMTPSELYKKLNTDMGDDYHLFFTNVPSRPKPNLIVVITSSALRNEP